MTSNAPSLFRESSTARWSKSHSSGLTGTAWPWPDVAPTDFLAGQNEFLMTRTMTPAEVAVLGIQGIEGGLIGLNVQKAGKAYSFALRPLLPDETS